MEKFLISYFLYYREYIEQKEIGKEEIDINLMFKAISKFFDLKALNNVNLSRSKKGLDQLNFKFKWDEKKDIFVENNHLYCITIDKLDNPNYQVYNKYYYRDDVNNQICIQKALVDIKNTKVLAYINFYDNGKDVKIDCSNIINYNIISGNNKLRKILSKGDLL